jgi:hypothetical protein
MVGHLYFGGSQFTPRSTIFLGSNPSEDVSFVPCHCCTASHLLAGGNRLLPRSTISLGQFIRLSTSPCSWLPRPTPLLPSLDWYHCGVILRELLMHLCGLHHSRIGVGLLCIRLRQCRVCNCVLTVVLEDTRLCAIKREIVCYNCCV